MNLDFRCERAMAGASIFAVATHQSHTCAECRNAQLFALQSHGALCAQFNGRRERRSILVEQPACGNFEQRPSNDLELATLLATTPAVGPTTTVRAA